MFLLPHVIEQSAERAPDSEAFRFNSEAISYEVLVERSNRLAAVLVDQGVCRGDRVGIYMHKCLKMSVAVYGIMQAGAAYVPLDPLAPAARIRQMVAHCGIRHLVSHPPKQKDLATLAGTVSLECIIGAAPIAGCTTRFVSWVDVEEAGAANLPTIKLMEQDLAYIMYTSGSTGTPKGMMHTHASGLAYARMARKTYGVVAQDRLANHSPLHFDMSTFEFFAGPLAGATSVIIPEAYTKLPASLSQLMEKERVTFWYSVPFALIQLYLRGALDQRDLSSLRWVLFGGEPFPPKYLTALMQIWPHAQFSNSYGPAEVNQCTYYHVPPGSCTQDKPVPIGRVCDNVEGLVVDTDNRPVSPGEHGELLIRSPTMMRGYWNSPDLTAKAFYFRPVIEGVSDCFYRTGDLVVAGPDGTLDFLGRIDRQVKSRGHRVELDEIETVLGSLPEVEEAAAFTVAGPEGSNELHVAVIARAENAIDIKRLRTHAAESLPWYAVPHDIRVVDDFPRTATGKINRRALQEIEATLQEIAPS